MLQAIRVGEPGTLADPTRRFVVVPPLLTVLPNAPVLMAGVPFAVVALVAYGVSPQSFPLRPVVHWSIVPGVIADSRNEDRREAPRELAEVILLLTRELHALHVSISNIGNNAILSAINGINGRLAEMETRIMASQAEIVADLKESLAAQRRTAAEIATLQGGQDALTAKIAELEALVSAGGTIGPELVEVTAEIKAQSKTNDDLIPDVVVPPNP